MDTERPHRTTSGGNSATSELFICFTSRLSSSSMKISSKSILSPGRNREPSSLSSSLSRRLRSNGSIRGGQASPMFPSIGKKRGTALENPEPSSPKVTCIGQVRVKTKKQGKKIRARSKRRGEVSFRRIEGGAASMAAATTTPAVASSSNSFEMGSHQDYNMGQFLHSSSHHYQQNQECRKWVHFPVTICEALRTFGAEFNCFMPCRSSCMVNQREKEEKPAGSNRSGCGAVFGRWLMVEGKEREIELVVGEEERRVSTEMRRSQRRHIFEDIEIKDEKMGEEEEEARVSVCVPPKNALLLMRCRSDPVKMAALANRFWESPAPKDGDEEKDDVDEVCGKVEEEKSPIVDEEQEMELEECRKSISCEAAENTENPEPVAEAETESPPLNGEGEIEEEQEIEETNELFEELEDEGNDALIEELEEEENEIVNQIESESTEEEESSPEIADPETVECEESSSISPETEAIREELVPLEESEKEKEEFEEAISNEDEFIEESAENEEQEAKTEEEDETVTRERPEPKPVTQEPGSKKEREGQQKMLPDCLLLMMCEPKLSMEVSKETWVCSTDFIRWLPERPPPAAPKKKNGGGDEPRRRISIDSKPSPKLPQPPRSSISFPLPPQLFVAAAAAAAQGPGGASMGTMIEQKLVGGKGYEPFVLKRCKSEPMRTAAKLAQAPVPDGGCFWKNRKMEPASVGVGAAGVGF